MDFYYFWVSSSFVAELIRMNSRVIRQIGTENADCLRNCCGFGFRCGMVLLCTMLEMHRGLSGTQQLLSNIENRVPWSDCANAQAEKGTRYSGFSPFSRSMNSILYDCEQTIFFAWSVCYILIKICNAEITWNVYLNKTSNLFHISTTFFN